MLDRSIATNESKDTPAPLGKPRGWISTAATCLIILASIASFQAWRHGSFRASWAALRGLPLSVDEDVKSFGSAAPGTKQYLVFKLKNHLDKGVKIVGGGSTCTCTVPERLPVTINPRADRDIQVLVTVPSPKKSGRKFDQSVKLYTNDRSMPELALRVVGTIEDDPKGDHGSVGDADER